MLDNGELRLCPSLARAVLRFLADIANKREAPCAEGERVPILQ